LRKKFWRGAAGVFIVIAGLLRGVLPKVGVWSWCFDGVIVVKCVVKVVF
jgi:hypothetical protein